MRSEMFICHVFAQCAPQGGVLSTEGKGTEGLLIVCSSMYLDGILNRNVNMIGREGNNCTVELHLQAYRYTYT